VFRNSILHSRSKLRTRCIVACRFQKSSGLVSQPKWVIHIKSRLLTAVNPQKKKKTCAKNARGSYGSSTIMMGRIAGSGDWGGGTTCLKTVYSSQRLPNYELRECRRCCSAEQEMRDEALVRRTEPIQCHWANQGICWEREGVVGSWYGVRAFFSIKLSAHVYVCLCPGRNTALPQGQPKSAVTVVGVTAIYSGTGCYKGERGRRKEE
jgi:hypothetical protein